MKIQDMQFGHYYVVEVSYRANNPIHRAIAYSVRGNTVTLVAGGYDEPIIAKPGALPWFRIIEEIPAMVKEYPNLYLLPEDAA